MYGELGAKRPVGERRERSEGKIWSRRAKEKTIKKHEWFGRSKIEIEVEKKRENGDRERESQWKECERERQGESDMKSEIQREGEKEREEREREREKESEREKGRERECVCVYELERSTLQPCCGHVTLKHLIVIAMYFSCKDRVPVDHFEQNRWIIVSTDIETK